MASWRSVYSSFVAKAEILLITIMSTKLQFQTEISLLCIVRRVHFAAAYLNFCFRQSLRDMDTPYNACVSESASSRCRRSSKL